MPCRDDWPVDYRAIQRENIEYNKMLDRLDLYARLLCQACQAMDSAGLLPKTAEFNELSNWWAHHQKFDKSNPKPRRRSEEYPGTCSASLRAFVPAKKYRGK